MKLFVFSMLSFLTFSSYAAGIEQLSVKLYDYNFSGNSKDIKGEVRILEKFEYSSGGSVDLLANAGTNKISSITVKEGFCAIVADGDHLTGTKRTLSPGNYNNVALGTLDNRINSIVTFRPKKSGNGCNLTSNVPVLYDGTSFTGAYMPLTVMWGKVGHSISDWLNESISSESSSDIVMLSSAHDSKRIRVGSSLVRGGGFTNKGSSLKVPSCYEVELHYDPFNPKSRVFKAGNYSNLGIYGLSNNAYAYSIVRDETCIENEESDSSSGSDDSNSGSTGSTNDSCESSKSGKKVASVYTHSTNTEAYGRTYYYAQETCSPLKVDRKYTSRGYDFYCEQSTSQSCSSSDGGTSSSTSGGSSTTTTLQQPTSSCDTSKAGKKIGSVSTHNVNTEAYGRTYYYAQQSCLPLTVNRKYTTYGYDFYCSSTCK